MKEIVYKCDNCGKTLSSNSSGKEHISVNFDGHSGWVHMEDSINDFNMGWRHYLAVKGIKQFCDGKCIGEYFDTLYSYSLEKS